MKYSTFSIIPSFPSRAPSCNDLYPPQMCVDTELLAEQARGRIPNSQFSDVFVIRLIWSKKIKYILLMHMHMYFA